MRKVILILISAICFVSCGSENNISELQEQLKQLEQENKELVQKNEGLNNKIDSLSSALYEAEATLERIYGIINN